MFKVNKKEQVELVYILSVFFLRIYVNLHFNSFLLKQTNKQLTDLSARLQYSRQVPLRNSWVFTGTHRRRLFRISTLGLCDM